IKPDNFRFPNIRPGALIDVFSRTGLSIVGFKVHRMSVAEAEEFYGPVLPVLEEHFKVSHGERLKELVENEFSVRLSEGDHDAIAETVGPIIGRRHWENLVQFMSGKRPGEVTDSERLLPGHHKTIALVYEGEDAVKKIREVLGPTDPSKAPAGTIRREFGTTVMINAAHASDSPENAQREMGLVGVGENVFEPFVEGLFAAEENESDGLVKKIRNLFQ
ncbi:MAG: nucleoside-diphosphate kinase, partial [Verrucomicrobiales bacterium]